MTVKADPELGPLLHTETSPTAASAANPLFGPSGVQTYQVTLATPFGQMTERVEAATGDEAAALALADHTGAKVVYVGPAPQRAKAD